MELTPLSALHAGTQGKIHSIRGQGLFFNRLRSLGLRPDVDVRVVREAPLGGPLYIRVGDTNLAVPKTEAGEIFLTVT